jgi:SMP-30/Gluconolactonase/LRE-like region
MGSSLETAQRATAQLGEGPTWDHASGRLVWVDILGCEVHHFDPGRGADMVVRTSQHVGAAKPCADGGLVLNLRDGVALLGPGADHGADLADPGHRRRPAADHIDGWIAAAELQLDDADLTEIATAITRTGAGTGPSQPSVRTERTPQAPSSAPDT